MSLRKGKFKKKNRGLILWTLVGELRQNLGCISFSGRLDKCLTIAVIVERKMFVCWSETLYLKGNPMNSKS